MIAHIVLLQPRPDLSNVARREALRVLAQGTADLPDVRSVRVGRRVTHGVPGYEQAMTQDFELALIMEFDDLDALTRYLRAPAHEALGALFTTAASSALAYDFDMSELSAAERLL